MNKQFVTVLNLTGMFRNVNVENTGLTEWILRKAENDTTFSHSQ